MVTFKKIEGYVIPEEEIQPALDELEIRCNTKTVAKGTKVYTTVLEGEESLEFIKAAGYTVQYKFYRSLKKKKNFKLMKTTKNTLYTQQKGTRGKYYYYRAILLVKDPEGNVVAKTKLLNCKYGCRKFYR